MKWNHLGSPVKKSSRPKKAICSSFFLDMRGPIIISSLEKGSTVNSANYCELLRQVEKDIQNIRRVFQSEGVILRHDIAKPYTAAQTVQIISSE